MKGLIAAAALAGLAGAGAASDDIVKLRASNDVGATMDALEAAVDGAGATIFARIDHSAGAAGVDMALAPAELLVFGNPRLGTPAMQDDPLAGLFLPLRVLVYEDDAGQVWLTYEAPEEMLGDLGGIARQAPYLQKMSGALGKLTAKAAGD